MDASDFSSVPWRCNLPRCPSFLISPRSTNDAKGLTVGVHACLHTHHSIGMTITFTKLKEEMQLTHQKWQEVNISWGSSYCDINKASLWWSNDYDKVMLELMVVSDIGEYVDRTWRMSTMKKRGEGEVDDEWNYGCVVINFFFYQNQ